MGFGAAKRSDFLRAVRTWAARHVGISGLGTNPTNPWCQHPGRPPLQYATAASPSDSVSLGAERCCIVCGLEVNSGPNGGHQL
jgi:hypothetical protein